MRLLRMGLIGLLACVPVRGEESSGGEGNQPNPTPKAAATYEGRELPWPVPEADKVTALEKQIAGELPRDSFRTLTVGPWVIATDLDEASARRFAGSTIAVYAARIQRQLFDKTPRSEPVKVYLFKDDTSYTVWNVKLFKERPSTPYGYYSRSRNALVMNIGTGGGTLLHEMAHAMAEADFPEIPAWLNEGIGSLFEASMDRGGKVVGFTNWRLTGLQKDIRAGTATRFAELLKMDTKTFYGARSGSNYSAARYLMQYLQDLGKLEAFYRRVRDGEDADALASLRAVFDDQLTVDEIERRVFDWTMTLKRP